VTEELPVVQSADFVEAQCKEHKKIIESVNKSSRDKPPQGKSSPTPTTTSAEINSGSCPPDHQNQQQCKAPSQLKHTDSFDDDDALDDELLMLDTTSSAVQAHSCSTPKAPNKQQMHSRQLRIDTGDSFDDMLDENDDNSCPGALGGNGKTIPAVRVRQGLIKPTGDCPDSEIKSPSDPTIPVLTRGASLFDLLDGDDLDFLYEVE